MRTYTSNNTQLGRNDKCHCGSGKKYKKCCMNTDYQNNNQSTTQIDKTTTMNSDRWKKLEDVEVYGTHITSLRRVLEDNEPISLVYPTITNNMSSDKVFELKMICDIENNGIEDPIVVRIIHNTPIDTQHLQYDVFMREMFRLSEIGRYNDFINDDTTFHLLVGTEEKIILEEKDLINYLIQSYQTDLEIVSETLKEYKEVG